MGLMYIIYSLVFFFSGVLTTDLLTVLNLKSAVESPYRLAFYGLIVIAVVYLVAMTQTRSLIRTKKLLKEKDLKVRSRDPKFIEMMRKYFNALGKQLAPLQVTKGGPILMVQIENEYGFYGSDKEYLELNKTMMRNAGFDVQLYTCDPPYTMEKGHLPGVLPHCTTGRSLGFNSSERLRMRGMGVRRLPLLAS